MKKSIVQFLFAAALLLSLVTYAKAAIYFTVQHNGSGWAPSDSLVGDDEVGYACPCQGVVTAPGIYLDCPYGNEFGWVAVFATIDTSYSVGTHYIGYFPGGADCYANITN